MRVFFIVTSAAEAAAGLALMVFPTAIVALLLGPRLNAPTVMTVARVAGAALLSLGVACWFARSDGRSRAAIGLVAAMLLYNVAIAAILAWGGIRWHLFGWGLWPVVALHTVMAVWCAGGLWKRPRRASGK